MARKRTKTGKMRKPRISKADMASRESAIIEAIKAGALSYRQIAEKFNVSLPTVNNKARKFGISRGRRKGAKLIVAGPRRGAKRRGRPARVAVSSAIMGAARRGRPPKTRGAGFSEAFRQLVLHHYPNITLAKFDQLMKSVESSVR